MGQGIEKQLYDLLVVHLLNHIPKGFKASSYLMELLGLGRESVYRRIRGDMSFTAEEIIKIAVSVNASIDDIVDSNKLFQNTVAKDLKLIETGAWPRIFQSLLEPLYDRVLSREPKGMILAINSFHPVFFVNFPLLFKFGYYQWLCQNSEDFPAQTFSELFFPSELEKLKEKIGTGIRQTDKMEIILDVHVFENLVRDIQYYHYKKLITNEERLLLKEELSGLINHYEQIAKKGDSGFIYLSIYLSIYSNKGLVQLGDFCQSIFRLNTISQIILNDPQLCEIQKRELNYLKRQSIGITQQNEIMQSEFFEKQRRHIELL
ncbi:hypothetical protein FACS189440_21630 [Bacteroidia bacterium]|nr:hypothetical protein FACS189440_21630 [Bacteroidia bacterium]